MFYQLVNEEKSRLGVTQSRAHQSPATYISIHRNCILEDGFVQLSRLPSRTLKGTVKVKFINEQVSLFPFLFGIVGIFCNYRVLMKLELTKQVSSKSTLKKQ